MALRPEIRPSNLIRIIPAKGKAVIIPSKTVLFAIASFLLVAAAAAETALQPIEGRVVDPGGEPIAGATIVVDSRTVGTTDEDGRFSFDLAPGVWTVVVSHPGHRTLRSVQEVNGPVHGLRLELTPRTAMTEWVTVSAIRAGDEVPITRRNLDREEIETLGYGQDAPALLQYTPSVTWYSDSGAGSNYSYLSLRGIQQTRINMTYDGVPLNDPAEHAVYFNNFHDFTDAVGSIQIQRGVGTSTVGAPAYGGSVNFASLPFSESSGGDARIVLGSFDTTRASLAYESGILDNGLAVAGRVSYADTAGYRDNSGSEHLTLFLNAGWQGERSSLKLVSFSGNERSQLAFLAVDPETLAANPRYNPLDEQERDDFGQDFAQLQYSRFIRDRTLLVASVYYNGAAGSFLLWDDPGAKNDLLDFGIDQYFVGSMLTATRTGERLTGTLGVHYNDFRGDHTLDTATGRAYENTGFKRTANVFGKLEYRLGSWLLYGDLQLRWAEFTYEGDVDLGSVDWTFVDPKIGFRRFFSPRLSAYASVGRAQREPTRMDLLLGEDNATVRHDLEAVRPEEVMDLEAGVDLDTPTVGLQANLYSMEFSNEIALTGELSAIGLPLRRNVEDSYRRGLELDLRWMMNPRWTLLHSSNFSRNRISEWTQFYDVYDEQGTFLGSRAITHRDVPPLLTPAAIVNLGVEWSYRDGRFALIGRHVAESHLDNTGNDDLVTPAYSNLDLRVSLDLGRWWSAGSPRLTFYVDNLLDDLEQYAGGYSYPFLVRDFAGRDTIDGIPYYYPLAGRNVRVKLEFDF